MSTTNTWAGANNSQAINLAKAIIIGREHLAVIAVIGRIHAGHRCAGLTIVTLIVVVDAHHATKNETEKEASQNAGRAGQYSEVNNGEVGTGPRAIAQVREI